VNGELKVREPPDMGARGNAFRLVRIVQSEFHPGFSTRKHSNETDARKSHSISTFAEIFSRIPQDGFSNRPSVGRSVVVEFAIQGCGSHGRFEKPSYGTIQLSGSASFRR
jgi:hypothetical protein